MDTELEHPSEPLDPLVLGVSTSAPLTDVQGCGSNIRTLLEQVC